MTLNNIETDWFLAQIKPNSYKIAEMNLKRQGFKTFLPMINETKRCNQKFVKVMQPLFPGYIFIALNIENGHWRKVNSTYGIKGLVSFNKTPTVVPQDLINQLMQRCHIKTKLHPAKFLKNGDKVTLVNGPFVNFVAKVENIASDQRAWLLIEIMGSQTRVSVEENQLRIVNE